MLLLTGYEQAVGGEAGAVAPGVGRSPVSEAGREVRVWRAAAEGEDLNDLTRRAAA